MERVQEDGVRLTEEELEERRQELLAKAEIQVSQNFQFKTTNKKFQAGEAEELDDTNARKILSLFEKRLRKNQELRIKFAKKPEKFMKSEVELHDMIQDIR